MAPAFTIPHVNQAACNVMPESGGLEPAEIFELAVHGRHVLFAAPTMVKRMTESPTNLPARGFRHYIWRWAHVCGRCARRARPFRAMPCVKSMAKARPHDDYGVRPDTIADKTVRNGGKAGVRRPTLPELDDDRQRMTMPTPSEGDLVRGATVMNGYWRIQPRQYLKGGWLRATWIAR